MWVVGLCLGVWYGVFVGYGGCLNGGCCIDIVD